MLTVSLIFFPEHDGDDDDDDDHDDDEEEEEEEEIEDLEEALKSILTRML